MTTEMLFPVCIRKHPDGRCERVDLRETGPGPHAPFSASGEQKTERPQGISGRAPPAQTVRWLPHGEPLPKGWKRCHEAMSHHSRHAVLIERVR